MLSTREQQVFDFIRDFKSRNGKVPSARQITSHLSFKSSRSAQNYITSLKDKGLLIRRNPETSAYALASDKRNGIPFLGKIAAGFPAEAYETQSDRLIDLPSGFFGDDSKDLFALEVTGNSMSGDFICEGDIAIIKKQSEGFRKDDILAVRVGSDEFTLKRLHFKKTTVDLIPSNPHFSTMEMPSEHIHILGKYVGLLRRS